MTQNVSSTQLVVERVEAKARLMLGLRFCSFLCSVLISAGVDSDMAIPESSARWLREQSRVPSLGSGLCCPRPSGGTMNPSDFHDGPLRFQHSPYTHRLMVLGHHRRGSPVLHCFSSVTCHPCYPGSFGGTLPLSHSTDSGLPLLTTGSASPLSDEATCRFACAAACDFAI
mgnify:CR=1 FL=1